MDLNFWDDRITELFYSDSLHPCSGCRDYCDGECLSNGACGRDEKKEGESNE